MGSSKTTNVTNSSSSYTPSPQELEAETMQNQLQAAALPGQMQVQQQGLNLSNQLLQGGQLPGYLGQLQGGVNLQTLDPNAIAQQGAAMARSYMPGYQQGGLMDSGVAYRDVASRLTNELLLPANQFNIGQNTAQQQFNTQNFQQLLNQALGGQASVQQPIVQGASTLAGLVKGTGTTVGTSNTTQTSPNPFLSSFQKSLGTTLGSPSFSMGPFGF